MPIYKLIKRYNNCPEEWKENMLFVKLENKELYRPLNNLYPYVYIDSEFVENNTEFWVKHGLTNESIFQDGVDVFFIPRKFRKSFSDIIFYGLKYANVPNEVKDFLEQYSKKNSNTDFPGSTKL